MDTLPRPRPRPSRAVAAGRLVAPALAAAVALSALLSSVAAWVAAGRLVAAPPMPQRQTVTLSPSPLPRAVRLAGPSAAAPGRWGLAWPGGYMQVGHPVLVHADGSVSRRVTLRFGRLPPADAAVLASVDRVAFPADPELARRQFPALAVHQVDSPNGPLPLWQLPAGSPQAVPEVIGAHGRGVSPAELLRLAESCARVGAQLWSVSYRHDPGSRLDDRSRMSLGSGEAQDLWRQVGEIAARTGCRSVVLAGVSLGGAAVANLLVRYSVAGADGRLLLPVPQVPADPLSPEPLVPDWSRPALEVAGVLLEAPALHWPRIVAEVASSLRLPRALAAPTLLAARLRVQLDPVALAPLAALERSVVNTTPALIVHGTADTVVPVSVSDQLAGLWPGAGYLRLDGVGHARGYNQEHERYLSATTRFLQAVIADQARRAQRPAPGRR